MPDTTDNAAAFRKIVASPVQCSLFLLLRLPMALLAGLRVKTLTSESAVVTVSYKYLNKNPFGSIYFACLSMAAELATGALCMMHSYKATPAVSMLVVNMQANFSKKALGKIQFLCPNGKEIQLAVEKAKATGQSIETETTSIGTDEKGNRVAVFYFTWSFKVKQ